MCSLWLAHTVKKCLQWITPQIYVVAVVVLVWVSLCNQKGSLLGNIPRNCIHLTALIFFFKTWEVKGLEQGHMDGIQAEFCIFWVVFFIIVAFARFLHLKLFLLLYLFLFANILFLLCGYNSYTNFSAGANCQSLSLKRITFLGRVF